MESNAPVSTPLTRKTIWRSDSTSLKSGPSTMLATPVVADGGRLSSLKLPRDLSLKGVTLKPKKTFTPNLNVARTKNKLEISPNLSKARNNRGRGDRKNMPHTKNNAKLVQSQGVFSDGIYDARPTSSHVRLSGAGGGSRSAGTVTRLSSNSDHGSHDDKSKAFSGYRTEIDDGDQFKSDLLNDRLITTSQLEEFDPPVVLGQKTKPSDTKIKLETLDDAEKVGKDTPKNVDPLNVFDNRNKLLFIQLPESLPGYSKSNENTRADTASTSQNVTTQQPLTCPLSDVNDGYLGKLIVYKSGAVKMKLGHVLFNVEMTDTDELQQNLISVAQTNNEAMNLGALEANLIVAPDLDSLLNDQ